MARRTRTFPLAFLCLMVITHVVAGNEFALAVAGVAGAAAGDEGAGSCAKDGLSCLDCQSLQYCSNGAQLMNTTCRSQSASKPYCKKETNECTGENTCVSPDPELGDIKCYRVEQRPEPLNCNWYVVCISNPSDGSLFGYRKQCPKGLNFNSATGTCRTGTACNDLTVTCKTRFAQLVQFKPYPRIFGFCPARGSSAPIRAFYCDGEYTFDESSGSCKPTCTKEGNIAKNGNCTAYFECYRVGSQWLMQENNCPESTVFNSTSESCEIGECSDDEATGGDGGDAGGGAKGEGEDSANEGQVEDAPKAVRGRREVPWFADRRFY